MKPQFIVVFLTGLFLLRPLNAERALIDVFQPTSLLGTEGEADPLRSGEHIAATIVSRPVIIGGAYPEGPVGAISLPHKLSGAPEGFPAESNLIVLVGGKVWAEQGEKEHQITVDFSNAKVPENLGVSLVQVMKITALCLQKTLGTGHERPFRITWLSPEGISIVDAKLPLEIK